MTFPSKNTGQCHISPLKLGKTCICVFCSFTLVFVGNGGETNCCCTELKVQVRFSPNNTFLLSQSSKETLCRKQIGSRGITAN